MLSIGQPTAFLRTIVVNLLFSKLDQLGHLLFFLHTILC